MTAPRRPRTASRPPRWRRQTRLRRRLRVSRRFSSIASRRPSRPRPAQAHSRARSAAWRRERPGRQSSRQRRRGLSMGSRANRGEAIRSGHTPRGVPLARQIFDAPREVHGRASHEKCRENTSPQPLLAPSWARKICDVPREVHRFQCLAEALRGRQRKTRSARQDTQSVASRRHGHRIAGTWHGEAVLQCEPFESLPIRLADLWSA